jgi:hypothetical protein
VFLLNHRSSGTPTLITRFSAGSLTRCSFAGLFSAFFLLLFFCAAEPHEGFLLFLFDFSSSFLLPRRRRLCSPVERQKRVDRCGVCHLHRVGVIERGVAVITLRPCGFVSRAGWYRRGFQSRSNSTQRFRLAGSNKAFQAAPLLQDETEATGGLLRDNRRARS